MREVIEVTRNDPSVALRGNQFLVQLHWEFAADLDLAALCVERNGNMARLVYHADRGARATAPWAKLATESDGDGRSKTRYETLVITRASAHEEIHLFVWDHNAVVEGESAPFAEFPESYGVSLIERSNREVRFETERHEGVNCLHIGSVLAGQKFLYHDRSGRLQKPERKLDALMELIT